MIGNTPYALWLSLLCPAGSSLPKKVYELFGGDLRAAYEAEPDEYIERGFTEEETEKLCDRDFTRANRALDFCAEYAVGLMTFDSPSYPRAIYDIPDPPPVLYYRGAIEHLTPGPYLTAVGTRTCTEAGYKNAYTISYKLACAGIRIVNGLATGIDSACLLGALDAGGFAVGFLGSGINVPYPYENTVLFERMFRQGVVLTEFSPFTQPLRTNFPVRNRLMSALGAACFVPEAGEGSGALITAEKSREFGRHLYAMPGTAENKSAVGSNELIKSGASTVTEAYDILKDFEAIYPDAVSVRRRPSPSYVPEMPKNEKPEKKKKTGGVLKKVIGVLTGETADKAAVPDEDTIERMSSGFSDDEKAVFRLLCHTGKELTSPEITSSLGMTDEAVLQALTSLEIYGAVRSCTGGKYAAELTD